MNCSNTSKIEELNKQDKPHSTAKCTAQTQGKVKHTNWSEVHNHKTQMHMRQLKQSTHANTTLRAIPEMFKHIKDRRTKQTRWSGQHNKMLCSNTAQSEARNKMLCSNTAQSEARKHAIKCNENAQWLLNSNSTREACMTCEHSAKLCSMHAFMQWGVFCPTLFSANPEGKKAITHTRNFVSRDLTMDRLCVLLHCKEPPATDSQMYCA